MAIATQVTQRDFEILLALCHCPLTLEQLRRISETFRQPFPTYRRVHERMKSLANAGWIHQHVYAGSAGGRLTYYTLSPLGHRIINGPDEPLPSRRRFEPVAFAREQHTRALAEFIVQMIVTAHRSSVIFTEFWQENELRLDVRGKSLYPDCAFELVAPGARTFSFYVELDNGTQPVRSSKDLESWSRKLKLYDELQSASSGRFRALIVSTRSEQRLQHIMATATTFMTNPDRWLFYGLTLREFLAAENPVLTPAFRNHRGQPVPLVTIPRDVPTVLLRATAAATNPAVLI